jgi:hypothetical protein
MSPKTSLCSYLQETKMSFVFSFKMREQLGRTGPALDWYQWEGQDGWKGHVRVNIV